MTLGPLTLEQPLDSLGRRQPLKAKDAPLDVPYGFCKCGCGNETTIAKCNDARWGRVKGEPIDFLVGHGNRAVGPRWTETAAGFDTPCWLWIGGQNGHGYGQVNRDGRLWQAHRWYWEQEHGPVPEGLELDHLCRNRACVRPDHLEPVTRTENTRRGAHARLTRSQAAAIKASDLTYEQLADRFGVSTSAVWSIKAGKNWRDL